MISFWNVNDYDEMIVLLIDRYDDFDDDPTLFVLIHDFVLVPVYVHDDLSPCWIGVDRGLILDDFGRDHVLDHDYFLMIEFFLDSIDLGYERLFLWIDLIGDDYFVLDCFDDVPLNMILNEKNGGDPLNGDGFVHVNVNDVDVNDREVNDHEVNETVKWIDDRHGAMTDVMNVIAVSMVIYWIVVSMMVIY